MKPDTKLITLGRPRPERESTINHPVHRASTIVSPDVDSYIHRNQGGRRQDRVSYGASGTRNSRELGHAIADLEGGAGAVVTGTGLSAVTMAIAAFVAAGDHVLVTDSVYGPTRRFCSEVLGRYGVETTYYDPAIGAGIEALMRDNTRMVFLEAPGSLTFEMQDVPAIAAVARARGAIVAMDNTWATPLFFRPLDHGVDISIQAGTKYIAGHSDLVIGLITCATDEQFQRVADTANAYGDVASPDDCWLALRGLRTMGVRLRRQQATALEVTRWLASRPEVHRVLYPALESDPGHALWKRDFGGASSLFGLALATTDEAAVARMVDGLELFRIGSSWGGYECLIAFNHMPVPRDVVPWTEKPFMLRLHLGLEDPEDIIADLAAGLGRLAG
ncbi:MAG: cystathionine beta-lyase [Ectothiorhodospiraceae bacterium]|nr:cystathionine beta-lyase [Chromatiales bacterium]MCP5153703.1 cystathionine beta-lyase [Ectothiorhodospiraceae bacterium]